MTKVGTRKVLKKKNESNIQIVVTCQVLGGGGGKERDKHEELYQGWMEGDHVLHL